VFLADHNRVAFIHWISVVWQHLCAIEICMVFGVQIDDINLTVSILFKTHMSSAHKCECRVKGYIAAVWIVAVHAANHSWTIAKVKQNCKRCTLYAAAFQLKHKAF